MIRRPRSVEADMYPRIAHNSDPDTKLVILSAKAFQTIWEGKAVRLKYFSKDVNVEDKDKLILRDADSRRYILAEVENVETVGVRMTFIDMNNFERRTDRA